MRDESAETRLRLDAAARAAPYVHPKLSSVLQTNASLDDFSAGELREMLSAIRTLRAGLLREEASGETAADRGDEEAEEQLH
jgi:hypothetical protein